MATMNYFIFRIYNWNVLVGLYHTFLCTQNFKYV